MLYNTQTKTRIDEQAFRMLHPNVSFPQSLTDDILIPYKHCNLNYPQQPINNSTEKVTEDGEELANGTWQVKWKLVEKTIEEIQAEEDAALTAIRVTRNMLLANTDWTQGADIPVEIQKKWAPYRTLLRDFTSTIVDPTLPYEFPNVPV